MGSFIYFVLPILIGGMMGLFSHASKNKGLIRKPKRNKATCNLGFILDMCFGSISSLVSVIFTGSDELRVIIFVSILAGYAGERFIKNLSDRNLMENNKSNQSNKELINEVIDSIDKRKEK